MSTTNIPGRLDRLPYSSFHRNTLLFCGLGSLADGIDVGITSAIMATLALEWNLTGAQSGLIGSFTFIGMFLGALLSGPFADKVGRKKTLIIIFSIMFVFTGLNGLAGGLIPFLVARLLTGIGLGASIPIMITYFSELTPPKIRGKLAITYQGFFPVGMVIASLLGFLLVPVWGWRSLFLVATIIVLPFVFISFYIKESPRWLLTKNRMEDANKITKEIEEKVKVKQPSLPKVENVPQPVKTEKKSSFTELISKTNRGTTIFITIIMFGVFFSNYGFLLWFPNYWVNRGFDLSFALLFAFLMTVGQIPGFILGALLIDRIGRKKLLAHSFVVGIISLLGFLLFTNLVPVQLFCAFVFNLIGAILNTVTVTYASELYPTRIRGTGVGYASSIGRVGGIVAPLAMGFIVSNFGSETIAYIIMIIFLAIGLTFVTIFGRETKGISLEVLDDNR